jgi:cysteine desulfurase / selenocysteine lyase
MQRPQRYLDNAATSWPKPEAVYEAVNAYQRTNGGSVGRAATRRGSELQAMVDRCRRGIASLLGAESTKSIIFTLNGTDALNQAIHGWLAPGDHVVTSVAEHNSILRPLRVAQERMSVTVDYVPVDGIGVIDPDAVRKVIRPRTRLIALTHASNVTGAVQPLVEVGRIASESGVTFLVDAAQSAGHVPIDVRAINADLLACSGHKGLLGPLGTGVLYVRPGLEKELKPIRQGGTGTQSESDRVPDDTPSRYEAGNHNAPGIAGLDAALAWIEERSLDRLREHEMALTSSLISRLVAIKGVDALGPKEASRRVGVVSVRIPGMDPQSAGAILDQEFGIECRTGLHCAPRMHQALGTLAEGGLVRFSVGAFNTMEDVEAVAEAVGELAAASLS